MIDATPQPACIASVHDGDTATLCDGEKIRIHRIDAPDFRTSPACRPKQVKRRAAGRNPVWCNQTKAIASRKALTHFLASGAVTIQRTGHLTYNRSEADLWVNGMRVDQYMVSIGMARWWR